MARSGGGRSSGGGGRSMGGSRSSGGFTSGGRSSIGSSGPSRSTGPSSRSITTPTRSQPSRPSTPVSPPRSSAPRPASPPPRPPSPPRAPAPPPRPRNAGNSFTNGVAMGAGMEVGRQLAGGNRNQRYHNPPRNHGSGGYMGGSMGMGRPVHHGGYSGGYRSSRRSSSMGSILAVIIILIIVGVFATSLYENSWGKYGTIPASTVKRDALPKDLANTNAPAIIDELGWISNQSVVMKGINDFYSKTGIWPTLYITNTIGGQTGSAQYFRDNFYLVENYLSETFSGLGTNTGNMLVFIFDDELGYDDGDWDIWLQTGTQSVVLMDSEASRIFTGYVDRYWYEYDLSDTDKMLRDIFIDSADRIMQVTRPWWHVPLIITIIGGTLLIAGSIGLKAYKRKKDAEAREMENTERILATDLKGLDDDATRLASEYEEDYE